MTKTTTMGFALLALSLGACARQQGAAAGGDDSSVTPDTGSEQRTGEIVVSGTENFTMTILQPQDEGGAVRLVGDLEPELRRLSGATVMAEGRRASAPPLPGLNVQRYEVVSIDGERPHVGTLLVRADGMWLAAADTVQLAAVPDALRTQEGAKVWIIGRDTEAGVQVRSYGVIRPAQR